MDKPDLKCTLYQATDVGDCPMAEKIAHKAANSAVIQTFAILGVNVENPAELEKFRKSLRFSDTLLATAESGRTAFVVAIIGMLAVALFASLTQK